jgi:competence protein ComEA
VGSGGASGRAPGAPVSLNTADLAALDTLPGVGPVLAQRILDWRAAHGRFASVDELGEVSGIGEKLLAQLGPLVTL